MPYLYVRHCVRTYGLSRSMFDHDADKQSTVGVLSFDALWLRD
jgi:hypothetical protein